MRRRGIGDETELIETGTAEQALLATQMLSPGPTSPFFPPYSDGFLWTFHDTSSASSVYQQWTSAWESDMNQNFSQLQGTQQKKVSVRKVGTNSQGLVAKHDLRVQWSTAGAPTWMSAYGNTFLVFSPDCQYNNSVNVVPRVTKCIVTINVNAANLKATNTGRTLQGIIRTGLCHAWAQMFNRWGQGSGATCGESDPGASLKLDPTSSFACQQCETESAADVQTTANRMVDLNINQSPGIFDLPEAP